jgi:hypothetical protein
MRTGAFLLGDFSAVDILLTHLLVWARNLGNRSESSRSECVGGGQRIWEIEVNVCVCERGIWVIEVTVESILSVASTDICY